YLNDLSIDKAISRATGRFVKEGRFIPLEYMQGIGDKPVSTYKQLKESGLIDYYEWRVNDGKLGEEARLIEKGTLARGDGRNNGPSVDRIGETGLLGGAHGTDSQAPSGESSTEKVADANSAGFSLPQNDQVIPHSDTRMPGTSMPRRIQAG
ncbi:MAG: hypothetical protein VB021_01485, partial [Oscillospiraceae bacterium]|nr:hypothetical protein [Oscillospiraceae bacterium]